jgi:hypothetical protein
VHRGWPAFRPLKAGVRPAYPRSCSEVVANGEDHYCVRIHSVYDTVVAVQDLSDLRAAQLRHRTPTLWELREPLYGREHTVEPGLGGHRSITRDPLGLLCDALEC